MFQLVFCTGGVISVCVFFASGYIYEMTDEGGCILLLSLVASVFFSGVLVVDVFVQPEISEEHTFCELYTIDGGFYIKNNDDKYIAIDLDNSDIEINEATDDKCCVEYIEKSYSKYSVLTWSDKYINNIYIPKGMVNLVTN